MFVFSLTSVNAVVKLNLVRDVYENVEEYYNKYDRLGVLLR